MTERQQLSPRQGGGPALSRRRAVWGSVRHRETLPTPIPPVPLPPEEPTILGFPAEFPDDPALDGADASEGELPAGDTGLPDEVVVLRKPDGTAGSLLMVAGAAGALSLFLPWLRHDRELGLSLVQRGLELLDATELARSGLVLPVGVVVGGGVLLVLGLLTFRPARTHRAAGVLALFVCLAVAAGVVIHGAEAGWDAVRTDPGILCAVVLAGLGLLGALKAMLTVPEVATVPADQL